MSGSAEQMLLQRVERARALGRPERAFDLCVAATASGGSLRLRRYAKTLVQQVMGDVPVSARTPARTAQVRSLAFDWPCASVVLGEIGFPTVRGLRTLQDDDCVVRARVEWLGDSGSDDLPPHMDETLRASVEAALAAARREERPCALRVRFIGPSNWTGSSAGLAVALAAVSAMRGAPVGDGWLASATVDKDGRTGPVGEMAAKVRLLDQARPLARCIVAADDAGNAGACFGVAHLADAIALVWPSRKQDVREMLDQLRSLVDKGRWPEAARLALRLDGLSGLRDDEKVLVVGSLLSHANHCANTTQQDVWNERLVACLPAVAAPKVVKPLCFLAVQMMDTFRIAEAVGWAEMAAAASGDDGDAQIHARGTLAKVRRLEGRFGEAVAVQEETLRLAEARFGEEAPRCAGDLSALLLADQRPEEALQVARKAMDLCERADRSFAYVDSTRPYLSIHLARAYAACGQVAEALDELRRLPADVPGLVHFFAQLCIAEWTHDSNLLARWLQSNTAFAESPVMGALVARTRGRLGDVAAQEALVTLLGGGLSFAEADRRLPY